MHPFTHVVFLFGFEGDSFLHFAGGADDGLEDFGDFAPSEHAVHVDIFFFEFVEEEFFALGVEDLLAVCFFEDADFFCDGEAVVEELEELGVDTVDFFAVEVELVFE